MNLFETSEGDARETEESSTAINQIVALQSSHAAWVLSDPNEDVVQRPDTSPEHVRNDHDA